MNTIEGKLQMTRNKSALVKIRLKDRKSLNLGNMLTKAVHQRT